MNEPKNGAPVFVKVADYKEILDVLEMIKSKVEEIRATLGTINTLQNEENAEVERWNNTISDIEKKIVEIDTMMFEPEHGW